MEEQHSLCPKDNATWCSYWKNPDTYDSSPSVFLDVLKPLFTNLSNPSLLSRCLAGHTQNQNEAINGMLWNKCLKNRFCGIEKLRYAVSETVCHFNIGSGSRIELMRNVGVNPSANMQFALRKEDQTRIKIAANKISVKARIQRRKLRAKRKTKATLPSHYMAGCYGLSSQPEDLTIRVEENITTNGQKARSANSEEDVMFTIEKEVVITFCDEENITLFYSTT